MPRLRSAAGVIVNVDDTTAARLTRAGWRPASAGRQAARTGADGPPTGTVAEVLAWVGDDRARAGRALEAERGRDGKARSTLVAQLEQLAGNE